MPTEPRHAGNARAAGTQNSILRTAWMVICAASLATLVVACGGGGGGGGGAGALPFVLPPSTPAPAPAPAASASNSVPLTVSHGANTNGVNLPVVSIQLCAPGTGTCQTIDNVLVDTGSTGLRIAAGALNSSLLTALPVETIGGASLNACEQFLDSYTWGTMRTADVTLGPKSAAAQPLQLLGDAAAGNVPSACSDNGTLPAESTPAQLGVNGIVGVSAFVQDCGAACVQKAIAAKYYTCASGGACQGTAVPLAMQAQNLVANFAQDNNGVVLSLPAISAAGQGSTVGTLYFGVGTQSNNTMSGATVLKTNPQTLSISVSYKNANFPDSFLDSGSNFFFLNDSTIAQCATNGPYRGFYCPASPQDLSASFAAATGPALSQSFSIANAQSLFTSNPGVVAVNNVAATSSNSAIDFGLPFFYGRLVGVVNEGKSALGQQGPFTALATP
ncbi:DUF3443 family protein [Variovorax sp. E3]|uniref:DUF3443 family protein n=1 Tax=Variovorax sp. E3 TaxID=1914993 RepID=UPI0018DDB18D|nr:DUF3443 family protein [Variovorax sp. E3]